MREVDGQIQRFDADDLWALGAQAHLDPLVLRVVERDVREGGRIEVGVQLAVDPRQDVQVEASGNTARIIVGAYQHGALLP